MSLQLTRSIYFISDIRMGRPVTGHTNMRPVTRSSVMLQDGHFEAWVEDGIYAEIRDPHRHTKIRVAWHMVRDYELEADALEADKVLATKGQGRSRAEIAAEKAKEEAAKNQAKTESDRVKADENRRAEAEAKARAKAGVQAGA